MSLLETLAISLAANFPLFFILTLIGTALWGDGALIFFVAFSVNYNSPLWLVFIAAHIGTMIGDSIWFFIGQKFNSKIEKSKKLRKTYEKITRIIEIIFGDRHLLALTVVKYLYGTRVITIFYLAREKIKYWKFIYYDFISTFFWIIGVGFIGWLIGRGLLLVRTFKNVQLAITLLILFFGLFYLFQREINYLIENRIKIKRKK